MENSNSEIRRLKLALAGTAVVAMLALAFSIYQLVQPPSQYLSAREFVLTDGHGTTRARLGASADGDGSNLTFYDESARPTIILEQGPGARQALRLLDKEGHPSVSVGVSADEGSPTITLRSTKGSADLGISAAGPALNLGGPGGGTMLRTGEDGAHLSMTSGEGERVDLETNTASSVVLRLAGRDDLLELRAASIALNHKTLHSSEGTSREE